MYITPGKLRIALPDYLTRITLREYRQGDILLVQKLELPKRITAMSKKKGRVVLAKSTKSWKFWQKQPIHEHAFSDDGVEMFKEFGTNNMFIHVQAECAELRHQEHYGISIPCGVYQVIRQRQWQPKRVSYAPD